MKDCASSTDPSTPPAPETLVNLSLPISPGAAGLLWRKAVSAGRIRSFLQPHRRPSIAG